MKTTAWLLSILLSFAGNAWADPPVELEMPPGAQLAFEEDWSTGKIDPANMDAEGRPLR